MFSIVLHDLLFANHLYLKCNFTFSTLDTLNMNSISVAGDGTIAIYSSPNVYVSNSVANVSYLWHSLMGNLILTQLGIVDSVTQKFVERTSFARATFAYPGGRNQL